MARMRSLQQAGRPFPRRGGGLPTLKVFGRAKAQARSIADVTDRYRSTTLATLRLTFLSSLVLELLATVSVALVAVAVGLRLLGGDMSFHDALFVLVLAPEAYLPLRALGANYHASADGMQAAQDVFALLEQPATAPAGGSHEGGRTPRIRISGLEITYPGRRVPALDGADLVVEPGRDRGRHRPQRLRQVDAPLRHPRACAVPDAGSVSLGGVDLADLDLDDWRSHIGWVPQRPHLFARSVAENVRLGRPDASDAEVAAALEAAGLTEVVRRLPDGADTLLGEGGAGLSAGERQRVVARPRLRARRAAAPARRAHGQPRRRDGGRRARRPCAAWSIGRTRVIVAHRPALAALADRVVELPAAGRRGAVSDRPRRHRPDPRDRPERPPPAGRGLAPRAPARSAPRSPSWARRPG